MSTTIKSTALDFNNIKNNLKSYLANKDEFRDYNFEGSALSNICSVGQFLVTLSLSWENGF